MTAADTVYLDARERNEYEVSHIRYARWVGFNDFTVERVQDLSKSENIIVYCSTGWRSKRFVRRLEAEGFTNVRTLNGGLLTWVNDDYPVYDMHDQVTNRVHACNFISGLHLFNGEKVYD